MCSSTLDLNVPPRHIAGMPSTALKDVSCKAYFCCLLSQQRNITVGSYHCRYVNMHILWFTAAHRTMSRLDAESLFASYGIDPKAPYPMTVLNGEQGYG